MKTTWRDVVIGFLLIIMVLVLTHLRALMIEFQIHRNAPSARGR